MDPSQEKCNNFIELYTPNFSIIIGQLLMSPESGQKVLYQVGQKPDRVCLLSKTNYVYARQQTWQDL